MNQAIVILLIYLILLSFVGIGGVLKRVTKKDNIAYFEQKLKAAKESTTSDNVSMTASLTVIVIWCVTIYFSVQSILSLVK